MAGEEEVAVGGREGDWECGGCRNRNYAFRSLCNRCKQPRLLVDIHTPAHSKWLPRIGDWICIGCTNNNYASREKCKKCGKPKEESAVPATEMPGSYFFSRAQGLVADQRTNSPFFANGTKQPFAPVTNWSMGGADKYGIQQTPFFRSDIASNMSNQFLMGPKGWRNGDWVCTCGFHNYASRAECKKCNASMPPALGTKRLASEEINELDNKKANVGPALGLQRAYPSRDQVDFSGGKPTTGVYLPSPHMAPNLQNNLQFHPTAATPTLLGKGAKQWRDGDWMCTNCSNHNYASRSQCNRSIYRLTSPSIRFNDANPKHRFSFSLFR